MAAMIREFLSKLFGGQAKESDKVRTIEDALSGVKWLEADQNPLAVRVSDCRSFSRSVRSGTANPNLGETLCSPMRATGEHHRGQHPKDAITFDCELKYPAPGGLADGPLVIAQEMRTNGTFICMRGNSTLHAVGLANSFSEQASIGTTV